MIKHQRMRKAAAMLLGTMLCAAALLTACGSRQQDGQGQTAPGAQERIVKDAMGHEVSLPVNPQRIIASYLEDPLVALGVKPVAQWSVKDGKIQDYLRPHLEGVPLIPSTLPPETVLSYAPDFLIIGQETSVQNGLYEQYSRIAPTFVLGTELTNDYRKTLLKIGELLGKTEAANKALENYDRKAAETREALRQNIGDKKVAILWITNKNFYVVNGKVASGAVVYGDLGLSAPNIVEVLPEAQANWTPISLEKLAQLNADIIFLVNSDKGLAGNLEDPLWKNIPAVKKGQIFEMESSSSWLYNGVIAGARVMDDLTRALLPLR